MFSLSARNVFLFWLMAALLVFGAGCSTLGGGGNTQNPAPNGSAGDVMQTGHLAQSAEIDEAALIAAAVATVEARIAEATRTAPVIAMPKIPDMEERLVSVYEKVNPSVVYIEVGGTIGGAGGSGSGFVYDDQGHIVTNNHVVSGASQITVVFADNSRVGATLVGTDPDSDLAVIKVSRLPDGVQPLPVGSLDMINVGQFVVAIGSPFGEQGSMSLGIVSGLGRSLASQRAVGTSGYRLPQVIQTDAPINPGNSGGPLVNLDGMVIGINSAIRTQTGTNSGVGFAIPADAVTRMVPSMIETGRYTYPYMGVGLEDPVDVARRLGAQYGEAVGTYVASVAPGSPADRAGLAGWTQTRVGDLIVALDDRPIRSFDDLNSYLVFSAEVGQEISVTVIRDGEELTLPLTLGTRP
jgi:2-alkenal reductase